MARNIKKMSEFDNLKEAFVSADLIFDEVHAGTGNHPSLTLYVHKGSSQVTFLFDVAGNLCGIDEK